MEAHRPADPFAIGNHIGDDDSPQTAHAALFAFALEQTGLVDPAHAVGVVVVITHVIEGTLGNEAQFALVVAHELVAPVLKIHEAIVRLGENLAQKPLIGQPVIIIDEIVQQIVQIHVRLLDDHVPAGQTAKTAPVARPLVYNQHIIQKIPGAHGGPHAAETATDDKQIRRIFVASGFFHDFLPLQGLLCIPFLSASAWFHTAGQRP